MYVEIFEKSCLLAKEEDWFHWPQILAHDEVSCTIPVRFSTQRFKYFHIDRSPTVHTTLYICTLIIDMIIPFTFQAMKAKSEKEFDFSEMYTFGKFVSFVKRLEKVTNLLSISPFLIRCSRLYYYIYSLTVAWKILNFNCSMISYINQLLLF